MSEKRTRLDVIRILIQNKSFRNQEELMKDLEKEGYKIAQPTLSRDLKLLKVSRIYDKNGRYTYVMPAIATVNHVSNMKLSRQRVTQSYGFLSNDFSGNIAVLHTLHGYANSLAAEIDEHQVPEILGSLAGDDTVLLILREGTDRDVIIDLLRTMIPNYDER